MSQKKALIAAFGAHIFGKEVGSSPFFGKFPFSIGFDVDALIDGTARFFTTGAHAGAEEEEKGAKTEEN